MPLIKVNRPANCVKNLYLINLCGPPETGGVSTESHQMDMGMRLLTNNHSIIKDHSIEHSPPGRCGVEGGVIVAHVSKESPSDE